MSCPCLGDCLYCRFGHEWECVQSLEAENSLLRASLCEIKKELAGGFPAVAIDKKCMSHKIWKRENPHEQQQA